MKKLYYLLFLATASCTAFTSPKNGVTDIRDDAPQWADVKHNPLDRPWAGYYWLSIVDGVVLLNKTTKP